MTGTLRNFPQKRYMLAVLILVAVATPSYARIPDLEPLYLTEAPAGKRGGPGQFESEHRPISLRRYRLSASTLYGSLQAFVRRPDGTVTVPQIEKEKEGVTVSFQTPFGDGPMHGIHTLYVIDQGVENGRLWVRTAKWHTVHHSCGWGHGYKYDKDRILTEPLDAAPLEILCREFWDGNFHSKVQSGDRLQFRVFSYGVPAAGAEVRLTSGRGWSRRAVTAEDGTASFQLIRDYYPERWQDFDRRHRERFTVVAESEIQRQGRFSGKDYGRIRYIASIPWTYTPSRKEYTSSIFGLSIGFITMALAAAGIYVYRERRMRPYREVAFNEKD